MALVRTESARDHVCIFTIWVNTLEIDPVVSEVSVNPDLQQWVSRLSGEKLPGFAVTAQRLADMTDDESTAKMVSDVVYADAAMTASVLKLANSVYYNPGLRPIDTLNYACVVLGVKVVRNLVLTAKTLGSVADMTFTEQFQREIAFSFHVAMQAQSLARLRGLRNHENIYIAALLGRLGYWMFWCLPYGYGERMAGFITGVENTGDVEQQLLGFTLEELTHALLVEWKLDALRLMLPDASGPVSDEQLCVIEANKLAVALRKGWQNSAYLNAQKRLMTLCRLPKNDLSAAVLGCVQEARATLKLAKIEGKHWPPLEGELPTSAEVDGPMLQQAMARDVLIQKQGRHLRSLTHMLCAKVDLPRFARGLIDGLRKGVGFSDVFILMPHPKKHEWRTTCWGGDRAQVIATSVIGLMESEDDCLAKELRTGRICWPVINPNIVRRYTAVFGSDHYVIFPLRLGEKTLGYLGAVKPEQHEMGDEDFEVFCHFCDLALVALKLSLIEQGFELQQQVQG